MNSSTLILNAYKRVICGTVDSRRLRKKNCIPAVIYAAKFTIPIFFKEMDLYIILKAMSVSCKLISIRLNSENFYVIIKESIRHPVNGKFLHFDFRKVKSEDFIEDIVPLKFIGADFCDGVLNGGVVLKHMSHIRIKCKVKYFPLFLDIDISNLKLHQSLKIVNLNMSSNFILNSNLLSSEKIVSINLSSSDLSGE